MVDLLQYMTDKGHSAETVGRVSAFFENGGLPIPKDGEFFKTSDEGALVLVSAYACAIRITSNYTPNYNHPRTLRPLLTRDCGEVHIDINPGLETPFTTNDYTRWFDVYSDIQKDLEQGGLALKDFNASNAAVLPAPYQDYHVIIDPGALKKIFNGNFGNAPPSPNPQNQIFGDVRAAFEEAWPEGKSAPDKTKMIAAWEKCKAMKDCGILVSSWDRVDYEGTSEAAQRYKQHLLSLSHSFS